MTRCQRIISSLAILTLLSGCGGAPRNDGIRDSSQPLSVTTRADFSALSGSWYIRAHTGDATTPTLVRFVSESDGGPAIEYGSEGCLIGGDCAAGVTRLPLEKLGPSRVLDAVTGREFWLVWIDEGLRTAAIGNPDGSIGWILDRGPTGGTDRIAAAREVLDFNGYDVSQLSVRESV